MRTLTAIATKWPWLTIAIVLGISAYFSNQLEHVRIDNELKEFLPEDHPDRQQSFRSLETFGGEFVAVIGLSVEEDGPYQDIFNPRALRIVDQLTEWLNGLEIDAPFEHTKWVKPEEAEAIVAQRSRRETCTDKQLEELSAAPTPAELEDYIKLWVCKAPRKVSLDDVISLATMKVVYDRTVEPTTPGGEPEHVLRIENLWDDPPESQEQADRVRELATSWSIYQNNTISAPDAKTGRFKSTAIYAFLPQGAAIEFSEELQRLIDEKIAAMDEPDDGLRFQTGGVPFLSVWLGQYLQSDLRRLIPFVLLVMIVVLVVSFRNLTGVALPFVTVSLATLWTVGLSGVLHKPLTIVTSTMPTLITAVGSAYTIHIVHHYLQERRAGRPKREAIAQSMQRVGLAVVMAGLTTVVGFLSLSTSSVLPVKDFGYLVSFGIFAALTISLTFAPAALVWLGRDKAAGDGAGKSDHDPARGPLGTVLSALSRFVARRRFTVVGIAIGVIAVCSWGASKLVATSDMVKFFLDDSEIRASDTYLTENFGGTSLFYLSIDGKEDGYWKEPEHLRKLDGLLDHIDRKFPGLVGKTISLNDYVKKMWMALHYDDPAYHKIPDTRQGISDCLFLFSQSSGALEKVADLDYRRVRISFKVRDGETQTMGKVKAEIDRWMAANMPEMLGKPAPALKLSEWVSINLGLTSPKPEVVGSRYYLTGDTYMQYAVDRLVVVGQMRSLSLSVLIVLALTTMIFRSPVVGLLSIVPILVTVLGNFAVMGFFGIPLDIGTALIGNAAVGCGIDYAIHYINRYRQERGEGHSLMAAILRAHLTSGKAIVFNALAVALGFFVLVFSNFNPVVRMGLLTGITMFTSSFVAMTLLPALIIWLRRFVRPTTVITES